MALDLKIGGMRKLNQREIVLVVLAVIIGAVGLFSLFRGEGGIGFTGPQSRFTDEEARRDPGSMLRVPEIDLAQLDEPTDEFENERDLFVYGRARPPRGGNTTATGGFGGGNTSPGGGFGGGTTKPPEETEKTENGEAPKETVAPLPDPPEVTLQFVGFIGPPEDKTVFLTDEEAEENYIAGVGEAVAGQFRIMEIGYEYVEVGFTDPLFEGQSERIILAEWSEEDDESTD
jgi:hypothetical protein